ncbi:MAG: response regulator [Candidatus Omnitrophica bacterium]|nr:response regulator [Candidatus Omnitrophota bacterium]MBU1871322.1 response regulator [Candidatus Omnitrophota bacterium]
MSKLLIVDDESDVREFAANFFKKRKFEVITSANGKQALDLFDTEKPDLILLDINMEGIDGIEILTRIREKNKKVLVIMVTGRKPEENESFNKCKELRVSGYIHKPLELDELEKVVLTLLKP